MKRLPLTFETGFGEEQLDWHWSYFIRDYSDISGCTFPDHPDDIKFQWEMYMFGAMNESQRG